MAAKNMILHVGKSTRLALRALARLEGVTVDTKARELIELGLAVEEDTALSAVSERRLSRTAKFVTSARVWDLDL